MTRERPAHPPAQSAHVGPSSGSALAAVPEVMRAARRANHTTARGRTCTARRASMPRKSPFCQECHIRARVARTARVNETATATATAATPSMMAQFGGGDPRARGRVPHAPAGHQAVVRCDGTVLISGGTTVPLSAELQPTARRPPLSRTFPRNGCKSCRACRRSHLGEPAAASGSWAAEPAAKRRGRAAPRAKSRASALRAHARRGVMKASSAIRRDTSCVAAL